MKKSTILFFALSITILRLSIAQEVYRIEGKLSGIPDSTEILLFVYYEDMGSLVATDTVFNGEFLFSDTLEASPSNMSIRMRDRKKYSGACNVWADNTTIRVQGQGAYLSNWVVSSEIELQKIENSFLDKTRKYHVSMDSLFLLRSLIDRKSLQALEIRKMIDSLSILKSNTELEHMRYDPNNLIAIKRLYSIAKFGNEDQKAIAEKLHKKLDTAYSNTLWGEGIKSELKQITPPDIGDDMIDLALWDLQGEPHSLSDYKGKYMLLDFWSMACYPCVLAAPELRELSVKYKDEISVIGLSMDTKNSMWEKATKRDSVTWINLADGKGTFGGASHKYGINGFPTYFIINPKGKIVDKWMGYKNGRFEERIQAVLNRKK